MDKERLREEMNRWESTTLRKVVEKYPERKDKFTTLSGIEVKRLYTPLDYDSERYLEELGFPGEFPFTRGVQPTMYRGRFWTMRQYAGFGTAEETNQRYKLLLEQGQTGLSVAFDLPTQMGYDSDHPMAEGEVGKTGVAIDTIDDFRVLFDSIPLDRVSTSMTINSTATILLAMYLVLAEERGIPWEKLSGTVQNDVLKEYIARGTYIFPVEPSMRLVRDLIVFCTERVPKWNTISISGYHIREAGATAVQELAFTFGDGIAYVEEVRNAGLDVDAFAKRLSFFFNSHNNFFEEVAKFRAARRIWAKIMKERFGAKSQASMRLRFHTQTGGSTLTAQDPMVNVIRVTLQALAAVLGGTQSLHTNSMDEALALPTEDSVRIALRTQQVLAYESGVGDVVDPLGGSYFVETLTNEIEERVWEYLKKIDEMGGMVEAIKNRYVQNEIAEASYRYQQKVESGEIVVIGVNKFQCEAKVDESKLLKIDEEVQAKQIERLKEFKRKRDGRTVVEKLKELKDAAKTESENLMPPIIECVKNNCTVGEITDVLREVFGVYEE